MIPEAQKEIDQVQIKLREEVSALRWIANERKVSKVVQTEVRAEASAIERLANRLSGLYQYLEDAKKAANHSAPLNAGQR